MEKWSDGRAKSEEVDEVLLKIINMTVPKELYQATDFANTLPV